MAGDSSRSLSTGQPRIEHAEMRGIVKRFPGVLAADHIDFDVRAGEVHALLGENGAGKSTLMKILYGLYQPNEGEICLNGERAVVRSPSDAIALGIGMIHQHFMLVPSLTVAENVALGLRSSREPLLDLDVVSDRIQALAKTYGLQVDPSAPVWQLAVGERQRVEIIKALYRGAALLILDEPTAVLTPQEVSDLFKTLRQMVEDGHALIFISHKLHEVLAISHRITVLRDGRVVGSVPTREATKQNLARMMVGRDVMLQYEHQDVTIGEPRLSINDLHAQSDRGTEALRGVNLIIRAGEILGLAGVSGNGQRELAEVIFGLRPATQGKISFEGRDVTDKSPA
ncbi:MAG TPA: ATP-binding cassette domain-containing protein, partial [Aggregatilineaceae bacterium]|nr:ATP-binding cassette domain-containing protein [Aggregatilineaceae bacterium]